MNIEFNPVEYFDVEFEQGAGWGVDFNSDSQTPHYDGPYEVRPSLREQTLQTASKILSDDITVHQIPITSTSNPQGGRTVLIG